MSEFAPPTLQPVPGQHAMPAQPGIAPEAAQSLAPIPPGWAELAAMADQDQPQTHVAEDYPDLDNFIAAEPNHDELMTNYGIDPAGINAHREAEGLPPITKAEYNRWILLQPPDVREEIDWYATERARKSEQRAMVHERLMATIPELYDGELPEGLEYQLGEVNYAVGYNQSFASTIEEAVDYLQENDGVSTEAHNMEQRFLIYDNEMDESIYLGPDGTIADVIEAGYYNQTSIGRFVVAFPETTQRRNPDERLSKVVAIGDEILPVDFEIIAKNGNTAVNTKYVAGFIDENGVFWQNNNFGKGSKPAFVERTAEPDDSKARYVAQNEQFAAQRDADFDAYVGREGLNVSERVHDYERRVQLQVRGIHEQAQNEGRELNDQEVHKIRLLSETVRDARQIEQESNFRIFEQRAPDMLANIRANATAEGRKLSDDEKAKIMHIHMSLLQGRRKRRERNAA